MKNMNDINGRIQLPKLYVVGSIPIARSSLSATRAAPVTHG
jgi:hypothetical protein